MTHPGHGNWQTGPVVLEKRVGAGMSLRTGRDSFRILDLGEDDCVIEACDGGPERGFAQIYDGNNLLAHCLIVVSDPSGDVMRCAFKRRTPARDLPPRDFAV
ncbi:hypothetical protein [Amaricoccus tamworthensis]|uniref:hypothetical protein n=1 Tax=Amaricoccus tamworthensis TaxID=57002 RepID=UPI003C7CA447